MDESSIREVSNALSGLTSGRKTLKRTTESYVGTHMGAANLMEEE